MSTKAALYDLKDIDPSTVARFTLGSATAVGGTTAIALYLKRLKELQERAAIRNRLMKGGNPEEKTAGLNLTGRDPGDNTMTMLASGIGAAGGGYGAWKLVHHLYQKHRENKAKEELQEAERDYTKSLQRQHDLTKSSSFSWSSWAGSILTAGLLATALGSGVAAHKLLSKKYPRYKPSDDWEADSLSPLPLLNKDDLQKQARQMALNGRPTQAEALEHLIRLGLQDKRANFRDCGVKDLICAAAAGRTQELKQAVLAGGVDLLFDGCKGARHVKTSTLNQNLAITWLARDPLLSEAITPVVVAEYQEMAPTFFKLARTVPEEYQEKVYHLFVDAGRLARCQALDDLCKKAGAEVEELITFPEQAGPDFFEKLLN